MQPNEIKALIEQGIIESTAYVDGEDGTHFNAIVISPAFIGKSRVQKQQLVYATVQAYLLDGRLHALSTKTFTPEEWQNLDNENRDKL